MSTRLTYTSGDLGAETDAAFEPALEAARDVRGGAAPAPDRRRGSRGGRRLRAPRPLPPGHVASRAHEGGPELVRRAVEAAARPRPAGRPRRTGSGARLLRAVAAGIGERHMELAALASLETGKSRTESILEVQEAIDLIEAYAGHMEENDGYAAPLDSFVEGERNVDVLRPYGVFGVIAPFNFPVALSIGMASSALIAGNTVVFKPSEETPSTGAALGEIAQGRGAAGRRLQPRARRPRHGARARGRRRRRDRLHRLGGGGPGDRAQAPGRRLRAPGADGDGRQEPGDRDGRADLDAAAEGIARSAFGLSGQKCSACSRAIVGTRSTTSSWRSSPRARASSRSAIRASRAVRRPGDQRGQRGALRRPWPRRRATGASPPAGAAPACRATSSSRPSWPACRTATSWSARSCSSPFVTVARVGSFDEALAEANAPVYGLTAGIFTGDEAEKERFLAEIQAGVVYVNRRAGATTGAWPGTQTFCGWKSSGSTGKGGLGAWYLPQFMREQSRTIVEWLRQPGRRTRPRSGPPSARRGPRSGSTPVRGRRCVEAAVHQPDPGQLGQLGVVRPSDAALRAEGDQLPVDGPRPRSPVRSRRPSGRRGARARRRRRA